MKRAKHSLSHYKLLTMGMGRLYPVACFEVLPGDTVQQSTSLLIRFSPMVAPVMHPVTVRVHHWFVPNRILWDGWEKFITGGKDGMGDGVGNPPTLPYSGTPTQKGTFADYIGIPPGTDAAALSEVSVFPWLAMQRIWQEWYWDQDFYDAAGLPPVDNNWGTFPIAWEKDYFTTARPWPQKGPDVIVPLGQSAPVVSAGDGAPEFYSNLHSGGTAPQNFMAVAGSDSIRWESIPGAGGSATARWANTKLEADLSMAESPSINDFRRAFAIQRYQEARARYGSRYTEYLAYLGVRSSDARLQRPEFLGGGKQTVSFSEVLQTGPGSTEGAPVGATTGVGTMAGHGISAMRSNRYRKFFEEHGWVLSLVSVRPKAIYQDGIPRQFTRVTKEDYWQRELEQIGQQEVYSRELYASAGKTVWGYQDRYSEYKQQPSFVAGDFRDTLDFWHLGRKFSAAPALNGEFTRCDPSPRIFQEQTTDPLWVMGYNSIQARRMVRASGSARII